MRGEATQPATGTGTDKLPGPYLLITSIPVARSGDGWEVPQLWGKDLLLHSPYTDELTLAAPMAERLPSGEPPMQIPDGALRVVPLPPVRSVLGMLVRMPVMLARLWREIGRAKIVHCGIGGWPIPLGWLAAPIARLRGRFLIIVVESAPWRSIPSGDRGLHRLKLSLKRSIYELLGRWCVRMADAAFFTHSEYQASLPPRRPSPEHVLQASWIDEGDILTEEQAARAWEEKTARGGPVRFAFIGRLTEAKGLPLLLDAIQGLHERGASVELDIYGFGELEARCREAAKTPEIRFMGMLPYGPEFFAAVRRHDAVVVPSLSDEQPRIVFDAFSQGVPILASATMGHRECVADGVNGRFFGVGDAASLARCLEAADRASLRSLGMAALAAARANKHQAMHRRRFELIRRAMAEGA